MKKKKLIFIILAFIFLCIAFYFIANIYAKYLTTTNGNTSIAISRWNILVNNISIRDNTDFSSGIVPVFPGNDNIAANIIAPSAEGYFDLNFDFSSVDVSFKYDITVGPSDQSSVVDLVATGYSIDGGDLISFPDSGDKIISDTILHTSNVQNRTIRVFIKWNDDETSSMDNKADTASAASGNPALFNVHVNFAQVTDSNNTISNNTK